ncbi:MAG: flagellar hook-basal body complex protein, partial [Armatimonadetes bacterium]|nr:flagellar hook-basal body complex protein [Armatimonadota bacterium]
PTGKTTDVAIEGSGYLMTSDGTQKYYTRDGSFYIDSAGYLVSTGSGMHVLGWTADPDTGAIDTSTTIGQHNNIKIVVGQTSIAKHTSFVELGGNLDSSAVPGSQKSIGFDVYDSHGAAHRMTVTFTKTSQPATWIWSANSPDRAAASPATVTPGATSAATIAGVQDISGGLTLGSNSDLVFSDGSGSPLVTVTLTNGMTAAQVASAVNAAFASVSPPDRVGAQIDSSGHLVLTQTTEGSNAGIRISSSSGSAALSALGLLAGSVSGTGNYFTPPSADSMLTVNGFQITVTPGDTAETVADKINATGAGVTATATNGKLSLTSYQQGVGNLTALTTTGAGWTLDDVFGVGYNNIDGTGDNIGSGQLVFDENGNANATHGAVDFVMANPDGATNPLTFNLDFTGVKSLAGDNTVGAARQDGLALGTLDSFAIGKDGVITGRFTNGISKSLAQLAMADFRNSAGLAKAGNNLWLETSNSGLAQIGVPANGSRGRITAGFLESSNVDLPTEFTNMIVAQRGFQANARLITTSDEVLQELVQLKR